MRTIHFSQNFYSSNKTVGATVLGGLWAFEWAWHSAETNSLCYFPAVQSAITMLHWPSFAPRMLFAVLFVPPRLSYFLRSPTGRCAQTLIKSKHTVAMW